MSRAEELWISDIQDDLGNESDVVFAENERTGQISIEPIDSISINQRSRSTLHFSAESLGRHVRGYYSPDEHVGYKGRVTIKTDNIY